MQIHPSRPRLVVVPRPERPPVPALTKLGALVIAFGLLADLVAHGFAATSQHEVATGFSLGEHGAHLVVLVGMVLVLAGIVAGGVRSQRRSTRQEGSSRHAVR
jgi:hypothetical protein